MLERTIKEAVKKRLKALGAYQFWVVPMGMGATTLDILVCHQGRFYGIECKRPGGKLTALQALTIEAIEAAGGKCFVIDNIEDAGRLELC